MKHAGLDWYTCSQEHTPKGAPMTTSIRPVTVTPGTPTQQHHRGSRGALIAASVGAAIVLGGAGLGVMLATADTSPGTRPVATSVDPAPHQPGVLSFNGSADAIERRTGNALRRGANGCTSGSISADAAERCTAAAGTGG